VGNKNEDPDDKLPYIRRTWYYCIALALSTDGSFLFVKFTGDDEDPLQRGAKL